MRVASVRLMDDILAAFIRGRRLFEGGVYIRKYGMYELTPHTGHSQPKIPLCQQLGAPEHCIQCILCHSRHFQHHSGPDIDQELELTEYNLKIESVTPVLVAHIQMFIFT